MFANTDPTFSFGSVTGVLLFSVLLSIYSIFTFLFFHLRTVEWPLTLNEAITLLSIKIVHRAYYPEEQYTSPSLPIPPSLLRRRGSRIPQIAHCRRKTALRTYARRSWDYKHFHNAGNYPSYLRLHRHSGKDKHVGYLPSLNLKESRGKLCRSLARSITIWIMSGVKKNLVIDLLTAIG